MTAILHLDASARRTRSISRHPVAIVRRCVACGAAARSCDSSSPTSASIRRRNVTEAWIAACFTAPGDRDASMQSFLDWSDRAIAELEAAELLVIGVPMYNYGMPSALKALVRSSYLRWTHLLFRSQPRRLALEPILSGKQLIVLSARGEFGFSQGGIPPGTGTTSTRHIATCAPTSASHGTPSRQSPWSIRNSMTSDTNILAPRPKRKRWLLQPASPGR